MEKLKLTKPRLYNEIMKEIDKIEKQSNTPEDMLFKLAGVYGKIQKIVREIFMEEEEIPQFKGTRKQLDDITNLNK